MSGTVYLNGRLLPGAEARIAAADRGFLLGDGLFETLRVRDGRAVAADRHLARLAEGLAFLGFPPPPPDLAAALGAVIAANRVVEGSARLTVSRGTGPRGVLPPETPAPTVLISAIAGAAPAPPLSLVVARGTRRNPFSPLSRLKTLNYLDSILARREAAAAGADDAILLNTVGGVAETTAANLILHLDGDWLTPPVADGALPGISRARLIEAGLIAERSLAIADLARAQAALAVNALSCRAVASIDGRALAMPDAAAFRAALEM
jgi:branched-chain amino acid aminotransferase